MSLKNPNSKRIAQKTLNHLCDMETSSDKKAVITSAEVPL